jgi:arylsulfatase A-like enzyme
MKFSLVVFLATLLSQCGQPSSSGAGNTLASGGSVTTLAKPPAASPAPTPTPAPVPTAKNVLLIVADDFNHWLPEVGYYTEAKTPNLSALAKQGVLFADASNSSPHCEPSRQALWSGVSPLTTGIDRETSPYIRDLAGYENVVTMNQLFKQNGYYTFGGGKLYHENVMGTHITDPANWTAIVGKYIGTPDGTINAFTTPLADQQYPTLWGAFPDSVTETSGDTGLARYFASKIATQPTTQPFFLAVGFGRPHLPWFAPQSYFDLYDPAALPIPKGYLENDLADAPGWWADTRWQYIKAQGQWKNGIRAYLAAISYMDFNVGIVLNALKASPSAKNTIVVFMGDNGWMLGEKEWFDKYHVQDQANRTTLIIYDPSAKGNGQISHKVVSLLDVYPTLAQLAGLQAPATVQGDSLVPLLDTPDRTDWDKPIFMRFRGINIVKTNKWRYIQLGTNSQLYDITVDPYEWHNLYKDRTYKKTIADLDALIAQHSTLSHY